MLNVNVNFIMMYFYIMVSFIMSYATVLFIILYAEVIFSYDNVIA